MNNQTPSQVLCGQQPELGRPAGRFALGLCLEMKSPWLAAMLPWQWGWGSLGPDAQPRGGRGDWEPLSGICGWEVLWGAGLGVSRVRVGLLRPGHPDSRGPRLQTGCCCHPALLL